MPESIKISVVICTLNEEKNIGRCISSVSPIADEIVVVDSFSTDNTEKICHLHGVRFIQHAFEGYIEQKNWAITQASNPIVLSLDADEALSEKLTESIRQVKLNWQYDGYYFNRLTNYCGHWVKHCGWYPDRKLRLWDSRKGRWTGINPHDRYEMDPACKTQFIGGDLLHFSFYTIAQHINTINKFSEIAALERFKKGKKASIFKILFSPAFKFTRSYFFKLGFLDGFYGFVICINSAHSTFLKLVKIRQLRKENQELNQ